MATTIADVPVTKDLFVDLNAVSSIAAGTNVELQNKSNATLIIQIITAQPSATSNDGYYLKSFERYTVEAGTQAVWARFASGSPGKVLIRDLT